MNEIDFIKDLSAKVKSGQKTVTYIVKGKWSNRGYKKLLGVKGEQIAEYDDGVLCVFPAQELLQVAIDSLPKIAIKGSNEKEERI
jgi:hypothetical protein